MLKYSLLNTNMKYSMAKEIFFLPEQTYWALQYRVEMTTGISTVNTGILSTSATKKEG